MNISEKELEEFLESFGFEAYEKGHENGRKQGFEDCLTAQEKALEEMLTEAKANHDQDQCSALMGFQCILMRFKGMRDEL